MKILILGGTGAMGEHLVRLLEEDGSADEICVTSRGERDSRGRVRYLRGNAHDEAFLRELLKTRWDVVVDFMSYGTEEFRSRADALLDATAQYVFLSSARVYADSKTPLTETSPRLLDASSDAEFLATDEYALAKARQENFLRDSGRKNWTVIRPYITFSEIRLQLGVLEKEEWLYRALHGRTIVFSEEMREKFTTLTYGLDVARGIKSVLGVPAALGEVFHITRADALTWGEVLACYLRVLEKRLGREPRVIFARERAFTRCHPAKYQIRYDRFFDRRFDDSKIARFADVNTFLPTLVGLEKCLNAFLDAPRFRAVNWVLEARKDRLAGERTPLSEISGMKQKIAYVLTRYVPAGTLVAKIFRKGMKILWK